MEFNLDIAIFVGFLVINLAVGLFAGRGIKNIKEYAIGDRNFTTSALAATIVATWISGSDFAVAVSETYKEGLWYLVSGVGDVFALLIIGNVFAPKMQEFFGSLSVAESMGNMYGKRIRIITAICSIAQATGQIAVQIKIFSAIFGHFLGFSSVNATLMSSFVVITYSAFGGIKSVTFTDVIQFFTFGIFIPIFALFIWQVFGNTDLTMEAFRSNPLFDYHQLVDYNGPKFWPYFFLLLYFSIPSLNSTMFQRALMARNPMQIKQAFSIAAMASFTIHLFSCFIGLTVLSYTADLDPNNIVMHIIDNYSFTGLKGLALIGIMAMIMSTADSWINTSSVIFAHDLCRPLGIKMANELLLSRLFSFFIGIAAIIMALEAKDLLKLWLLSANFYKPIVTVPLILAILGFRSTPKAVGIGMFAGGVCVIMWKNYIAPITDIDSVIPAMATNLIFYLSAHYLLKQPGGWVKKGGSNEGDSQKKSLYSRVAKAFNSFSTFDAIGYFQSKAPKTDVTYIYFAFAILLTMIVSFSIDKSTYQQHAIFINTLQATALFTGIMFLGRNMFWPNIIKEKYTGIIWYISVFIGLAFISSLLVLISKFSQVSLVVMILHFAMIGMLLSWQTTLGMIIVGVVSALYCYTKYIGDPVAEGYYDVRLKILYIILMLSGFMLAFIKPKQEQYALSEEKNDHLSGRIELQESELRQALALKKEFIRNVTHEYNAPMTGIISMAEAAYAYHDKLSKEDLVDTIDTIYKSALRLNNFDSNISTLAKLSKAGVELSKERIDLSNLVHERVQVCRKLYEDKQDREFIFSIAKGVKVFADRYYITQTIDNLIINAITYCKKGNIIIELECDKAKGEIQFTITDEGVGIPRNELYDIFDEFKVSSKTHTPAGGRGVGLAVAKKVIEVHGGKIWADSDGESGASFCFVLRN